MSRELTAAQVMQENLWTVAPDLPMLDLERLLIEKRIGGVPVVDGGRLLGIISRSDVVRHLGSEQAPENIETEYYWDLGGVTTPVPAQPGGARAHSSLVEQMLADLKVADLMVKNVVGVAPPTPVSEVARLMVDKHIHRVFVIDGEALLGVITTMDLTRLLAEGKASATG